MCCSDPPPPPDYSSLAEGSEEVARIAQETAREQLDWAREQDTLNRETLGRVLDVQLPIMEETFRQGLADRARYTDVFQPLEDELIREAQEFATPERQALEAGRAIQDVGAAFDAEKANATRELEGYGIDPSETRYQALDVGVRTAAAAAKAFAGTGAARRTEDLGRAMRADAINIGRGMPSQVAQSYGTSLAAGSGAVGGANQTTATSTGAMAGANQFYNTALGGYTGAAGIQNTGYQNSLDSFVAGEQFSPWAALGQLGGQLGSAYLLGGEEGGDVPADLKAPGPTDAIPALLAPGEYVVPAEVVRAKGTEFFDKLNERYTGKGKES